MKKNEKKIMKKVAPLALVGVLAAGGLGASAWLTTKDTDTVKHSITAGTFKLSLSGDVGFENTKAYPVSDEVGKAATTDENAGVVLGTLTVTNSGEVSQVIRLAIDPASYYAGIEEDEKIADGLINLYITDETGATVYDGTLADANTDKGFGAVAVLDANDHKDYTVRLYVDDTATNTDLYTDGVGRTVQMKLAVLGIQNDGGITTDKDNISTTEFEAMVDKASFSRN